MNPKVDRRIKIILNLAESAVRILDVAHAMEDVESMIIDGRDWHMIVAEAQDTLRSIAWVTAEVMDLLEEDRKEEDIPF